MDQHDARGRTARLITRGLALLPVFLAGVLPVCFGQSRDESFLLHPDLQRSLFAREPDVVDPVAVTFDEDGRAYVVEMRDYPLGIGPDRKPGGTIRLLEDTDGDGKADRSTLFAEGLRFPTSIAPWKGGVFVTAPPDIIYLKDTDGDGKADVREVYFTGFTVGVTDSNVNGLRWGLDNRLHGLNGGNSGTVNGLPLEDKDFSFDPASKNFAATFQTSGGFGLVFDDWGRSFATYNINHLQHRFVPSRYLDRCPGFPPMQTTTSISDHEEMSRIYPVSVAETRPNHPEQAGYFSSAGGMGYIGSPIFGGDLRGSVLVCDVVGNLVHRDLIVADGPGFVARRAESERQSEFFASRDNAFRPVGLETGPDGALYLIDMQRDVIEHPDYIPEKVKAKINLRAGEDRGRIYRIAPKSAKPSKSSKLSQASGRELVALLESPNPWLRGTAQRLLVERQDKQAVAALEKLAASSAEPLGRLRALWTLRGLGALSPELVLAALRDASPGVRENALLLAEPLLGTSPEVRDAALTLARDENCRVRFQAALTLGGLPSGSVRAPLLAVLRQDLKYRWSRVAVLTALRENETAFLESFLADPAFADAGHEGRAEFVAEVADLAGARLQTGRTDEIGRVLEKLGEDKAGVLAALGGLLSGLERNKGGVAAGPKLAAVLDRLSRRDAETLAAAWRLGKALGLPESDTQRAALNRALAVAADPAKPEAERIVSIRLLALGGYATVKKPLLGLLDGAQPPPIQAAVLESLRAFKEVDLAKSLLEKWRDLGPQLRIPALNFLLQQVPFHGPLLDAIESGAVQVGELNLDLEQRRTLLRETTPENKVRAAKFISDEEYSNRKSIVSEWMAQIPAEGDAARGKAAFEKNCAQCHRAGSLGARVGPELTDLSHRSVEDLLSNILDPNMAINPSFITYNVETNEGELETGILQSQSAEAVVLLQAQEKKVVIPRRKIKSLKSSGLSLMPEGLEKVLTPRELRDLIAFLQSKK